ncbi:MAG: right-handed parallel beta-helix repeat-containing protein, partial [Kiritimatiellae bacterium]|nr:right-handed parallel beta-helix repeat-containing protein [Kiritimatiellia bacterium]
VYTGRPFEVADDLDYAERLEGKMDIGCYVSPETVNESAGDSAHILTVIGSPNGYGSPTPAYGANPVQDGTLAIDLSAMLTTSDFDGARCVPVEDGIRAIYMGYTYTEQDAQAPLYEAGPSAESFTLPSWQTNATFTILWKAQNRVIASSGAAGCLVSVNGCAPAACVTNWIDNGATYTLAFTASENFAFGEWSGDFPEGAEYRTPATTATSDRPRSISVTTVPILHVSAANGSDATGNGTRASPYATISHAISQASAGSSIYVQGGTYEEAVANNSLDSLSLVGGFDAGWTRDLRSSPSTVKSPSRGTACIMLGAVRFNTVRGFVLTGGSYGIYMTGPSSVASDDRNANVNNFEQLIVTNNVTGICKEGAFCGFRIVSCLVAENANDGIRWNSDNRARGFIHNCTVVRNGRSGVALNYGYSMFDVRNTISAFNGTYGFDFCRGAEDTRSGMNYNYIGGICAYGNALADVRQAPDLFCSLDSGTARRTARLCLRQRVFLQNPLLDDDGTPLAGSPCIGTGDNLTAYPLHGEFEDLYGTAWNGAYDIGCVKGGAAPVRTATDVYVAPDGDDANSGLSAAAPMASIQKALAKLADGGTCHLAAGEYAQDVGVYVRNATLQGAGAGKTVITGTTNPDGTPSLFNVFAAADGVIVRGITSAGGYAGFTLGHSQFAKGMTLDGCEATGNTNGLYAAGMTIARSGITPVEVAFMPDCTDNSAPDNRITHCRFIDNGEFGMLTAAAGSGEGGAFNANIDNCLFARNGLGGIYLQDGKAMTTRLYYCTIVGNGGAGVANGVQNDNAGYVVVNSVVAGNEYGFKRAAYTVGSAEYSLVSGNTVADFDSSMWTADQTACSGDDAALDARTSVRHYAHLTAASPAIGLARALTSSDAINDPVDDLDHRARKPEKHRDAGCFAYGLQEGTKLFLR